MSRAPELAASTMERRHARLYLIGLGLSVVGDTALSLVAGMWVKSLTGSSALAGLTQTCIYIPSLFGPLAGLVADRVPRQRFLIVVNLCSSIAVACLLFVHGREQIWAVFAVMTAYGTSLVLVDPAETALFAQYVPAADPPTDQRLAPGSTGIRAPGLAVGRGRLAQPARRWGRCRTRRRRLRDGGRCHGIAHAATRTTPAAADPMAHRIPRRRRPYSPHSATRADPRRRRTGHGGVGYGRSGPIQPGRRAASAAPPPRCAHSAPRRRVCAGQPGQPPA